jgi:hypothetical protein
LNHVYASTGKDDKFKVFGKNSTFNWVVYGERHPIVVEPTKSEYESEVFRHNKNFQYGILLN